MRKIIHGFENQDHMQRVLQKIQLSEKARWRWEEQPTSKTPYYNANDIYLCLNDDRLTYWSRFNQYWKAHWSDDIVISADDYLKESEVEYKVGDKIEIIGWW